MDDIEDDEGHGAAMLSVKSHSRPTPVVLSNNTSSGKLRSRQPAVNKNQNDQLLHHSFSLELLCMLTLLYMTTFITVC